MPDIYELAKSFRAKLLKREAKTSAEILRAFETVLSNLKPQIEALEKDLETVDTISKVFQLKRYKALESQIKAEIKKFSRIAGEITTTAQKVNLERALDEAKQLIESQISNAFINLPTDAIENFVGLASDGSPLNELFAEIGKGAAQGVKDKIITGIALGHNPRKLASEIRRSFGTPAARALVISRTESLRAYRESSRAVFQTNKSIVSKYIRLSARTARTCAICWALDGEIYETSEPFASHPACRCSILPYMGKPLPSTGAEIFASLDDETQIEILGRAKHQLYSSGEIILNDLVGTRRDKRWGKVRFEKSLRDL